MKRSHHFSLFMIAFGITLLMLPFFVEAQNVTVTVDGKAIDNIKGVTIAITTADPVDPPIDPPDPPIDPPVDPPADCGAFPPNGVGQSWLSLFGVEFPGPKSRQAVVTIPRNGYRAVAFNTGTAHDTGAVINFEAAASVGQRQIAISRCPGDFDVESSCKETVGTYQRQVNWRTRAAIGNYCKLDKGTTYYFNTRFLNCTGQYCNTTLRASNRDYR